MKFTIETYGNYWRVTATCRSAIEREIGINQLYNCGAISTLSIDDVDTIDTSDGRYIAVITTTRAQFLRGLITQNLMARERAHRGGRRRIRAACVSVAHRLRRHAEIARMDYMPREIAELYRANTREIATYTREVAALDYSPLPSREMVSALGTREERDALEAADQEVAI